MPHRRSAFTLIELLVVIAIIAILSTVILLVLSPAEILRKGRDSNRLSDLPALNTALSAYAEDRGGSMGSSSVTYISIPDPTATTTTGTDCAGLGSPFTGGGSFHCSASSTLRKVDGTGWIPINLTKSSFGSPIGSLPVDPANTTSSGEYYSYQTDGTAYKITALPESQAYLTQTGVNQNLFTTGTNLALGGGTWILVPGNSIFGTNNFYVMKYTAACTRNGVALTTPTDNGAYNDANSSGDNCKPANNLAPSSLSNAIGIVDVSQTSAISYCANIGAHLITNNEWQTIAWNIEGVASNWSGGVVGSGAMSRGNSNGSQSQVASSNDTNTDYLTGSSDFTHRRTQTLSNGGVIWDMNGNLFTWTSDTITGTNEPYANTGGFTLNEFTDITQFGTLSQPLIGPANSAWNTTQAIGMIFTEGQVDATTYAFTRGSTWNNSFAAGIESMHMSQAPSVTSPNNGLRCAR